MTTIAIDRQAPFRDVEVELLQSYLDGVVERVAKYLTEINFLDQETGGYWEDRGYEWFAGV